jgi:DNA-binding NtrC family response regulator
VFLPQKYKLPASGQNMNSKLEILVLDDEEIVCTRLKAVLEKAGSIVETYTDSRQAKAKIEQHRFDIIVTDYKMANINGMELFNLAKNRWPDCEVIMITGFATAEVTREALLKGVRDVIPKPFKIAQFKTIIDQVADRIRKSRT